jgi:hypothetical protein
MKYAWRTVLRGSGNSQGTLLSKLKYTACRGRWPSSCRSGGTTNKVNIWRLCIRIMSLWRMTKRIMSVTTPTCSLGLRESRGLSRQSWGSASAGSRPIEPASNWNGSCGFASVLLWARKWTRWPTPRRFQMPSGVSKSARHQALTVFRTGPSSIIPSGWSFYWRGSSTRSSECSIFLQYGSTLESSPFWNPGRTRHFPLPIGPYVF